MTRTMYYNYDCQLKLKKRGNKKSGENAEIIYSLYDK